MDIREYLQKEQKGFYKIITENLTTERRKQLYDAINDWHKSELKLLGIGGVSQQRELLLQCYKEGFQAAVDSLVGANEAVKNKTLQ
jgi:hypothetical protein